VARNSQVIDNYAVFLIGRQCGCATVCIPLEECWVCSCDMLSVKYDNFMNHIKISDRKGRWRGAQSAAKSAPQFAGFYPLRWCFPVLMRFGTLWHVLARFGIYLPD
jgi:hypothetical protein